MKTVINLNNGDQIVADLIERNCDRLKVYCRHMCACRAIDLYLNNGIDGYEVALDDGVYLTIAVDDVYSMMENNDEH